MTCCLRLALVWVGCAVCVVAARPVPAQTPAAPESDVSTLNARSTLVMVPALVRTKGGALVHTLTANDFVLTDDGIPQKLTLEEDTGGEPLALVVAIEIGGAGAREFDKLGALAPMIESVVGDVPHKVAVVAFDSQATVERDFTPSMEAVEAAIDGLTPGCTRQHHIDNCGSPLAVHNVGLGDNGAAILDSIGFSVRTTCCVRQAATVPTRHSADQRDARSRQPHDTWRGATRYQRYQYCDLQHWIFDG